MSIGSNVFKQKYLTSAQTQFKFKKTICRFQIQKPMVTARNFENVLEALRIRVRAWARVWVRVRVRIWVRVRVRIWGRVWFRP